MGVGRTKAQDGIKPASPLRQSRRNRDRMTPVRHVGSILQWPTCSPNRAHGNHGELPPDTLPGLHLPLVVTHVLHEDVNFVFRLAQLDQFLSNHLFCRRSEWWIIVC